MNYLIDTCVLSELKKRRPHRGLIEWFESIHDSELYVSILTLGELLKGIEKLPDSDRKETLSIWVENELMNYFAGRTLQIDYPIIQQWSVISAQGEQQGRPLPVIDGLLAATALQHGLTLVTRNVKDIEHCGVAVFNPWSSPNIA